MKFEQYKFKFYLNANHAIRINGKMGQVHPHTWEICVVTIKLNDNFVLFGEIESSIDQIFDQYQEKLLNEMEPFNRINPTLENICKVFKNKIQELLKNKGWRLLMIEVSETPARSYIISLEDNTLMLHAANYEKLDTDEKNQLIDDILYEVRHSKN